MVYPPLKRKVRDEFGNWVLRSDDESEEKDKQGSIEELTAAAQSDIKLDWRDYIALAIASLETVLLPLVIFILIILAIVVILAFMR